MTLNKPALPRKGIKEFGPVGGKFSAVLVVDDAWQDKLASRSILAALRHIFTKRSRWDSANLRVK